MNSHRQTAIVTLFFLGCFAMGTTPAFQAKTPSQISGLDSYTCGNSQVAPHLIQNMKRNLLKRLGVKQSAINKMVPPPDWQGMPTKGTVKVFNLLIDFANYPHQHLQEEIHSRSFGEPNQEDPFFPYESLRAFYLRSSYEQLSIEGNTLGWYTTSYPRSYIAPDDAVGTPEYLQNREQLIKEALTYFADQGHDFSQYDADGDGVVDQFNVIWAGTPSLNWGSMWWGTKKVINDPQFTVSGIHVRDFIWQPELNPIVPEFFHPLVLIHETGHALGLPDFYDYKAAAEGQVGGGVGGFDMMAEVADHNCFSKYLLGWIEPQLYTEGNHSVVLRPSSSYPDAAILMPQFTEGQLFEEFFMVQYRDQSGNDLYSPQYEEYLGLTTNSGLVIWHVDAHLNQSGSNFLNDNSYSQNPLLQLVQADGLDEIGEGGIADSNDWFLSGQTFGPETQPSSNRHDGTETGLRIDGITQAKNTVGFKASFSEAPASYDGFMTHFAKASGGFSSKLICTNTGNSTGYLYLEPFSAEGLPLESVTISLEAGQSDFEPVPELFNSELVSHCGISGSEGLQVSVAYQSLEPDSSPVHLAQDPTHSHSWLFYPGNGDLVWDGLAIVNRGDQTCSVTLRQLDKNNQVIREIEITSDLEPMQKTLYVVQSGFDSIHETRFEVRASQPVSLIALRGSNSFEYLWENKAIPLD